MLTAEKRLASAEAALVRLSLNREHRPPYPTFDRIEFVHHLVRCDLRVCPRIAAFSPEERDVFKAILDEAIAMASRT